jgi:heme/copper-type cytochrome/quinol oxidase subunit 4
VFAVIAGVLALIAFVLHWAGKGTNPFDPTGVYLLAFISLCIHLWIHYPFWPSRPPR